MEPPTDVLPDTLRDFVVEVSRIVDVSPELVLGPLCAALVGCLGTFVRVKVGDTHEEPMALWSVAACPPGERKSAVMMHIAAPIFAWEEAQELAQREQFACHETAVRLAEEKIKLAERKANGKEQPETGSVQAEIASIRSEIPTRPRLRRIILQDITPERIPRFLQESGGPALVLDDEGGFFTTIAGRYSKSQASNLDAMLKSHAGSPIRVDRLGRSSDHVDHPAVSVALFVQPQVLDSLSAVQDFEERGFIQRIALILARPRAGHRTYQNATPDSEIISRYREIVTYLLDMAQTQEVAGSIILRIEDDALAAWTRFHDDVERRIGPGGELEDLSGWASKLPGLVARLAAMFHLVDSAERGTTTDLVSCSAIQRACELSEYLAVQAIGARGFLRRNPSADLGEKILIRLEKEDLSEITTRDLHQLLRKVQPADITRACRYLEELGYLAELPPNSELRPGRKSSPTWRVNPSAFKSSTGSLNSHNSQNSRSAAQGRHRSA